MLGMARKEDLARHQNDCLRATEEMRRESREDAREVKRMIERLQDQVEKQFAAAEVLNAARHAQNQAEISNRDGKNQRDIAVLRWTLWSMMGALVTFLVYAALHGGLAGIARTVP